MKYSQPEYGLEQAADLTHELEELVDRNRDDVEIEIRGHKESLEILQEKDFSAKARHAQNTTVEMDGSSENYLCFLRTGGEQMRRSQRLAGAQSCKARAMPSLPKPSSPRQEGFFQQSLFVLRFLKLPAKYLFRGARREANARRETRYEINDKSI
jgi:hypothetical protein